MAYLSRRCLGLVVSVSAGIGMASLRLFPSASCPPKRRRRRAAVRIAVLCKSSNIGVHFARQSRRRQKVNPVQSRWESSAPIRYPDPDIVVLDRRFRPLVVAMAAIERIATGFRFTEGPAWYGDGRYLLFSDIPNDALLRWDEITGATATLRHPAGYPDGNTRDRQGRLVTCELGSRTLTRTEHDGTVTVLAASFQGTRLTGPNDVVVKSDGSIWFSDNGAGIRGNYLGNKGTPELPYRVYRIDGRTSELTVAIDDMARPNGLAFSPDESRLYVVDTPGEPKTTHVYDMTDGGTKAANGRVFF